MGEDNRRGRFVEMVNASVTRTLVGDDIGDGLALPKSKIRFGVLSSVPILLRLILRGSTMQRLPKIRSISCQAPRQYELVA